MADAPVAHVPFVELYAPGWSGIGADAGGAATDVILFSVLPRADGSIDATTNGLTAARIDALKRRGSRALIAIGGERSAPLFRAAPLSRTAQLLAAFVKSHGLDGVVIDVEPLEGLPAADLAAFVRDVREAVAPRIVTAVVAPDLGEIARLASFARDLERVTIMSYLGEPSMTKERQLVDAIVALGVARRRIGLGIGPRTPREMKAARLAAVREGAAGGVALWGIPRGAIEL